MISNQQRTKNLLDKIQALRDENEKDEVRSYVKVRNIHLINVYMSQLQDFLIDTTEGNPIN